MPYELLERLCVARTPLTIDNQADIEKLQVLKAAQMIEADLPPVLFTRGHYCYAAHAVVMRVTPQGHAAIEKRRAEMAHAEP